MSAPQDALAQAAACIVELKDQLATVTAERDAALARVAGLEAQRERERDAWEQYLLAAGKTLGAKDNQIEALTRELDTTKADRSFYVADSQKAWAERDRLRTALREYGQHHSDCDSDKRFQWGSKATLPCSCGLAALTEGE